jgi:hypothetical protein
MSIHILDTQPVLSGAAPKLKAGSWENIENYNCRKTTKLQQKMMLNYESLFVNR